MKQKVVIKIKLLLKIFSNDILSEMTKSWWWKLIYDENSKTQAVTKLKNSNCDNVKNQMMKKIENSNCDKTQKPKWWQN